VSAKRIARFVEGMADCVAFPPAAFRGAIVKLSRWNDKRLTGYRSTVRLIGNGEIVLSVGHDMFI